MSGSCCPRAWYIYVRSESSISSECLGDITWKSDMVNYGSSEDALGCGELDDGLYKSPGEFLKICGRANHRSKHFAQIASKSAQLDTVGNVHESKFLDTLSREAQAEFAVRCFSATSSQPPT